MYTRYDSPTAVGALVPRGCELVGFHGVRTLTPTAAVFKVPAVGALFRKAEFVVQSTPLARLAGFLVAEIRRR